MLFVFGKPKINVKYSEVAGSIKDELTQIFKKRGIAIEEINIDVNSSSLNVQVYVGTQQGQADCASK